MAKRRKLLVVVGVDIADAEKKLKQFNRAVETAGKTLTKSFTAPLLAIGALAGKAAYDLDDALDKIRAGTGATGEALKALGDDFRKVAGNATQNFDTVATVIADVNTRLGYSGKELRNFSQAILDSSRLKNTDFSSTLNASARAMQNWNVSASDSVGFLDKLFVMSQSTGIGLDRLAERVARDGASFRQLGFSVEESMALLGNFEKKGAEVEKNVTALHTSVAKLTKSGITNIGGGFREAVLAIKDAGSAAAANVKAIEIFGSSAGPEMASAIKEGRFEIEALVKELDNASGAIQQTVKDTDGFKENLARLKNKLGLAFEPLGNSILSIADEAMAPLLKAMEGASLKFSDAAVKVGILTAALGPLTVGFATAGKAAVSFLALLASPAGLAGIGVGVVVLAALAVKMETVKKEAEKAERAIQAVNGQFKTADSSTIQTQLDTVREKMKSLEEQALNTAKATNAIKILNAQRELAKEYPVGGGSRVPNNARVPQRRGSRSTLRDQVKPITDTNLERIKKELNALEREETVLSKLLNEAKARESAGVSSSGGGGKGGGGKASKKSPAELLVASIRDQIKYMNADGEDFLPVLDEWLAKLGILSDDWKLVKDLQMGITDGIETREKNQLQAMTERHKKGLQYAEQVRQQYWSDQAWMTQQGLMSNEDYLARLQGEFTNLGGEDMLAGIAEWTDYLMDVFAKIQAVEAESVSKTISSLNSQFEKGTITAGEYESVLSKIAEDKDKLPLIIKLAREELERFQQQQELALVTLDKLVKMASKDLAKGLTNLPDQIGSAFTTAIAKGENLGDVFKSLLQDIGALIIKAAVMRTLFGGSSGGLLGGLFGGLFADGGVFVGGRVAPFAKGGVVSSPTLFPMANGAGLMGEAGPEGILPLTRIGGKLGVYADLSGDTSGDVTVNVINQSSANLDVTQTDIRQDPITRAAVIEIVVNDYMRNGSIRQAIRRG